MDMREKTNGVETSASKTALFHVVEALTEENMEKVVRWRRHLHSRPELSFEEFDTADFIVEKLTAMGYTVKRNVGGTGVVATFESGKEGPVIAFRADMDALPILEETGLPFESERAGLMHACGHDGHMAILLGTAQIISQLKEAFCGTIKFIFQPGEEANGGAKCVIHDGVLKNPDVEGIFGLHMIPELPVGTIGIKAGYLSATDDEFVIRVQGKGAHSSEPETGVNAIVIASHIVTAMDSILSHNINPFDVATLSICQINGGDAINVVPDSVEMKGMLRCIEKADKEKIRKKMENIARHTAQALGGESEIEFIPGFPSVNNDPALTKITMKAASQVLNREEDLFLIERPHMGSEDFAYYQEEVPGVMFMLGCSQEEVDTGTLHSPTLNINEKSFSYGIKIFTAIALEVCGLNSGADS